LLLTDFEESIYAITNAELDEVKLQRIWQQSEVERTC
jgi:hypothetical protein